MNSLEWEHVWAGYGRVWALRDFTLAAEGSRMLCLMGEAGSGKSTALRAAAGRVAARSGRIWVNGRGLARARASIMAYPARLPGAISVQRYIERRTRGAERLARPALHAWGLDGYRSVAIGRLPDSARVRVGLAAQWVRHASVWVLDDPTNLLEPEWRFRLPELLSGWMERESGTVVMATHEPEVAASAHQVAILHGGRVVASDAPASLCAACACEEITVRTVNDERAADALASTLHLEAERLPQGLRIRVRKAEAVLPGVLQQIGALVETVWVRRPTLRDAVAHFSTLEAADQGPSRPPRGRGAHADPLVKRD